MLSSIGFDAAIALAFNILKFLASSAPGDLNFFSKMTFGDLFSCLRWKGKLSGLKTLSLTPLTLLPACSEECSPELLKAIDSGEDGGLVVLRLLVGETPRSTGITILAEDLIGDYCYM